MGIDKTLYVTNRNDWRVWLEKNHNTAKEVWLIYYKKHTGKPSIDYEASVEEALCFGWIDSIIKRLDIEKYARKFTPRISGNKWSMSNLKRLGKMIKQGRMTECGIAKIDRTIVRSKKNLETKPLKKRLVIPEFLKEGLAANKIIWRNFNSLAPSHKRNYIGWIMSAKKEETRQRRLKEAIRLLTQNKKLGLK